MKAREICNNLKKVYAKVKYAPKSVKLAGVAGAIAGYYIFKYIQLKCRYADDAIDEVYLDMIDERLDRIEDNIESIKLNLYTDDVK